MSTIRDDVARLWPETVTIAPGITLEIKPIQGQVGYIMKYVSGGSLGILPTSRNPYGQSGIQSTTGVSYLTTNIYTVGTNEILNLSMTDSTFVYATGATLVFSILRLRTIGDW